MGNMLRFVAVVGLLVVTPVASRPAKPEISYRIDEGDNINAFVRNGPVAAHLRLRSGSDPRILVVFPAGNSGVGLWFDRTDRPTQWVVERAPSPVTIGTLNGIVTIASIDAPVLAIKQAVLSNVRFLRDYQAVGRFPPEIGTQPSIGGETIRYRRDRLDGKPGYELTLRVLDGRIENGTILAAAGHRIRMEITALTGDTPLTPLPVGDVLNARAAADPTARNALSFLSYREKFLAGSWRFDTYFGRDTLMSVRLLMPALHPAAIEAGLNSVLARLSTGGEVSHEEGIAEFAIVQNRKTGRGGAVAELDYKMVDDDFMLAPVVAEYLAGIGPERGRAYLARKLDSEAAPGTNETVGAALVRNLRFVLAQATPFATAPSTKTLIAANGATATKASGGGNTRSMSTRHLSRPPSMRPTRSHGRDCSIRICNPRTVHCSPKPPQWRGSGTIRQRPFSASNIQPAMHGSASSLIPRASAFHPNRLFWPWGTTLPPTMPFRSTPMENPFQSSIRTKDSYCCSAIPRPPISIPM